MKYDVVFLDADQTLFDFHRAEHDALRSTCLMHAFPFREEVYAAYHEINDALWKQFERGQITQPTLRIQRFEELGNRFQQTIDPRQFQTDYAKSLGSCSYLLPGALTLCRILSNHCPLYILTNGSADTQHSRLSHSEIAPYITRMFISEELGYQKPQKAFFDAVFAQLPPFERSRAILLGDSPSSDMAGGRNAGIATCWFHPDNTTGLQVDCDYQITTLEAFVPIVLGAACETDFLSTETVPAKTNLI